jgi:hypothetical protein
MRQHATIVFIFALGASLGPAGTAGAFPQICSILPTSVSAAWYPSIPIGGGLVLPAHVGMSWTMGQDAGGCLAFQTPSGFITFSMAETGQQATSTHYIANGSARSDVYLGLAHQRYRFCVQAAYTTDSVTNFTSPVCSELVTLP